ncbi:glycosyltransferase [Aureisphaera galaxeae]|uniref:glycosyltransferase n=1 Tax=Aureisphaera galaxeae TaxID=1538023 RepID=UPI002350FC6E|nr:glycosyltransferase [Aureisphaera galaxeae]MDC8004589.1 glycosyltransferase [Aureisphaera galaxeae]
MRILQVINSLATGGAEKLILDTVPKLNEGGTTCDVALLDATPHSFLKQLEETGSCKIHTLAKGSVYSPKHIFKLRKLFKEYDLIHVHLFPGLYWAAMAKWLSGSKVKMVFTEHNTSNRRRGTLMKWVDRWMYKKYDKIVAIAGEVEQNLQAHLKAPASKFVRIPNGVDIAKIRNAVPKTKTELDIYESHRVIIQVSSFTEQKDQATLIKAMAHLEQPTALLLVGKGPKMDECKMLAYELQHKGAIHFTGARYDVPALLKMADVVVLSSHFEGLSLSSIEGMASGRPFVASAVPGLTPVVKGAGVLFEEGNDKDLADKLNKLLADSQYAKEVAIACKQRASEYDIHVMVQKLNTLYRALWENQN